MKKAITSIMMVLLPLLMLAQGWPANYGGVMMQGFSWNSFTDTRWTVLESQADDFGGYIDLLWLPQSGYTGGNSMGYDPLYFFDQHSSFGTEAQLRSLIATLKAKGTGCIADVVVNHHKAATGWLDFPSETYNGVTYQLKSTDVTKNDDGGKTLTWANENGYTLSDNYDTGEDWDGCRDLDHNSANVQKIVNAYLNFLLNDMGYVGFRYDMVRGFSGSFLGQYNAKAKPRFSVGEHWTNSSMESDWMNSTRVNDQVMSAVFDFDFHYVVKRAFNNSVVSSLAQSNGGSSNWPLVSNSENVGSGYWRQFAVTFVENHDVQDRGVVENYNADPLRRDTLAANAFMLGMPGTPCIFLPHWKAYKQGIKGMIDVRKAVGVKNTSSYTQVASSSTQYAVETTGTGSRKLLTVVGSKANTYNPGSTSWKLVVDGYHYRYYMSANCETAWVDKASGYYDRVQTLLLTAVSANSAAKLVYTTDGTTPSATNGTQVASGSTLRLDAPMTLKVGLLKGSTVSGVVTRVYDLPEIEPFVPHKARVFFRDPSATTGWEQLYYWAYDGQGILNPTKTWPGDSYKTDSVMISGKKFYYKTFDINTENYTFNMVFNNGNKGKQNVDITGIEKDVYYQLGAVGSDGKYKVSDVTRFYESANPLNQVTPGDIDNSGEVDGNDLNILINIILGKDNAANYDGRANVDGEGNVDGSDVNALINILLGK